jgi:hypothetical protein
VEGNIFSGRLSICFALTPTLLSPTFFFGWRVRCMPLLVASIPAVHIADGAALTSSRNSSLRAAAEHDSKSGAAALPSPFSSLSRGGEHHHSAFAALLHLSLRLRLRLRLSASGDLSVPSRGGSRPPRDSDRFRTEAAAGACARATARWPKSWPSAASASRSTPRPRGRASW